MTLNDLQNQNSNTITVSPLSVTLDALKTTSAANLLASPRIRARNKEKAKILIGSKVPVITTAATASGNGGVVSNTQVQYLDVGLTLEVEPQIYSDNDVAIGINLIVSSIASTVKVGDTIAYELRNRNATTKLQLKDGETQILAGLIKDAESRSATSVPGPRRHPDHRAAVQQQPHREGQVGAGDVDHAARHPRQGAAAGRDHRVLVRHGVAQRARADAQHRHERASRAGRRLPGRAGGRCRSNRRWRRDSRRGSSAAGAAGPAERAPVNVSTVDTGTVVGLAAAMGAGSGGAVAPSARIAALQGITEVPSGKPTASDGPVPHVTRTLNGPSEVKVGDEFTVTLQLQSDQPVSRVRSQLRFDGSAFQLLSGDPGGMVPDSTGAKVIGRQGGAQLEVQRQRRVDVRQWRPDGAEVQGPAGTAAGKLCRAGHRPGRERGDLANSTPTALSVAAAK